MKSSKEKRLGTGRVAFLARIEIFKEKINAGHTIASVYEDHQEDLGIGYKQFVNYVNRYIKFEKQEEKKREPEKVKPEEKYKGKSTTEILNSPVNKEDII